MKLIEALKIVKAGAAAPDAATRTVFLACGFTPLHLQTFLAAHLQSQIPESKLVVKVGLFGDLAGNLERLDPAGIDAVAAVIEWSDLDPRLGIRALGGWPADLTEVVQSAEQNARRLEQALTKLSREVVTVVCTPTLPLPPMFASRPVEASPYETALDRIVASLADALAQAGLRVVSGRRLAQQVPAAERYDVRSDINAGFPYSLPHASAVAGLVAELIQNRPPMKGLITDLDDTLWSGIVGEQGIDGISWHLDRHSQMHGVYQQVLASLAKSGTLIAVASKNDASLVTQAFERPGLLVSKDEIFPFEVHWSHKSESVKRILDAWNIGADSVMFIDDNPLEVAEVKAAFPSMDCKVFPKGDDQAIFELLKSLRDAFGKNRITEEDKLRLQSLRSASGWQQELSAGVSASDDFLRSVEATVTLDLGSAGDLRAFELINKTNQFNLNGRRLSEAEWRRFFENPGAFLLTASYKDKFGALGKIAVIMGRRDGRTVRLEHWVMSCRAFSRRIEDQCLKYIFESMGAEQIFFDYQETARNGPLTEFLKRSFQVEPCPGACLSKSRFVERVPQLFHQVEIAAHA